MRLAAEEAGDEVDGEVADAAEGEFDERSYLEEDVHVHAEVEDAEVEEDRGEDAPVLVGADGGGEEVAASAEDIEPGGGDEGDAACQHGEEDQGVRRDEGGGDGVGRGEVARAAAGGGGGDGDGGGHAGTVLALS